MLVHFKQKGGHLFQRGFSSKQHMVLGVLQIFGRHPEQIAEDDRIVLGRVFKAGAPDQANCRRDDCLCCELMSLTIFKSEDIADQMKRTHLPPTIRKLAVNLLPHTVTQLTQFDARICAACNR
ncbi:hypothetical protein SE91_26540 [Bradyrhizobium sp. DOA1]|nr:hypothetical protein SE91_26540 [Bradyrhizobium sp. DOA1]